MVIYTPRMKKQMKRLDKNRGEQSSVNDLKQGSVGPNRSSLMGGNFIQLHSGLDDAVKTLEQKPDPQTDGGPHSVKTKIK